MEDLSFAIVLTLVAIWLASWATLSSIIAGFVHASPQLGALLGVTLGPFGLLASLTLPREGLVGRAGETRTTPVVTSPIPPEILDPFA